MGVLISETAFSEIAEVRLNFSTSSASNQLRRSRFASTGKSPSSTWLSSHESGSLKILSARALPGMPEVSGVGDIKGESRTSRSG